MNIRLAIRDWLPPAITRAIQHLRYPPIHFEGSFADWEEVTSQCNGYDNKLILAKVLEATQKVIAGEAAYERDSVLFDEFSYEWSLLAGLMLGAARNSGSLSVLDFGGALGSTYFQNRAFLKYLTHVSWNVVEQPHYVKAGLENIQNKHLNFYSSIEKCIIEQDPKLLLLSSVLQYLSDPIDVINILLKGNYSIIIIDRTFFVNSGDSDRICIQHVPSSIYAASYPCRFFAKDKLFNSFTNAGYAIVAEFDSVHQLSSSFSCKGAILSRKDSPYE